MQESVWLEMVCESPSFSPKKTGEEGVTSLIEVLREVGEVESDGCHHRMID